MDTKLKRGDFIQVTRKEWNDNVQELAKFLCYDLTETYVVYQNDNHSIDYVKIENVRKI